MATVNLGRIKFVWQGAYSGATAYVADDVVSYNGSSYICILASTGNLPTNATYWQQMSSAGTNGTNGTDLTSTLTTQGDIVYRNASGLARLGAGTNGQVLTTAGAGANPSWSTVSSDFVKLVTASTSNTATLSVDGYFSSTYKNYFFQFRGRVNTNAEQLSLIYRQSNADVTSGYYSASFQRNNGGAESGNHRSNHDSMLVNSYDCNSNSSWGYAGNFYLFDPLSTSTYKYITYTETSRGSDDYIHASFGGGWYQGNTNALSGFSFMSDQNGNITGEVTLYGLK